MRIERTESKYMLSPEAYGRLLERLAQMLEPDPNNGDFGYSVRSVYFDSHLNQDFYEKVNGDERRKKMRLRVYGEDMSRVRLEIKAKDNVFQSKESLWLCPEDALAIQQGEYDVLLKYDDPIAERARSIFIEGAYRPVVRVDYLRKAFIGSVSDTRITLDTELRASEFCLDLFDKDPVMPLIPGQYFAILEVKSTGELPHYIRRHLHGLDTSMRAISKYRNARWFYEEMGLI